MNTSLATLPSTADAIMAELMNSSGNHRRKETLQRLKEACDAVAAEGPIRLAAVEREIERRHGSKGGPKAQSISNERKLPLGMYHYVEAREREREAAMPRKGRAPGRPQSPDDAVLRAIESGTLDMDARSALRDLYDRHMLATKALDRAKALLKTINPGIDLNALLSGEKLLIGSGPRIEPEYVEELRTVVTTLSDDDALAAVGLLNDGGRVRRKAGTQDELFSPKTTSGLAMLLKVLD